MNKVPPAALWLGLAGVLPFVWGTATVWSPDLADLGLRWFGPRYIGPYVELFYGGLILCFMSGVLWGFAAQRTGPAATAGYALSVLPALWTFLFTGDGPERSGINLAIGFVAILGLDCHFWRAGLTPPWWLTLRVPLTIIVVVCLLAPAL
jgi:hypothetical protein